MHIALPLLATVQDANKEYSGGRCGIRTHGPFRIVSFQDWCNKPDSANLPQKTYLEHRVRFELTVLRICNPLHWASLPPVHIFGVPRGIRTPTSGFGDRHAAVDTRDTLFGAGNRARTGDLLLGKQMYYQLYYTRIKWYSIGESNPSSYRERVVS